MALALSPLLLYIGVRSLGDPSDSAPLRMPAEVPTATRWLAVACVAEPSSSQVSLLQDVALAADTFGEGGVVLFGAGPGTRVQVAARSEATTRSRLAAFFDPRDRATRYLELPSRIDGAADDATVQDVLTRSVAASGGPLTLLVVGHGERGEEAGDASVRTWGGWPWTALDLADALEGARETVRLVVTTCYGGGFAHAVFREADPDQGLVEGERCGFFATTWDREASGCDPDPERGRQDGYAMHFLSALRGHDRFGHEADLDLDGDGVVSMLEAHTHARISGRSFDVPITTSAVWLRHRAPAWTFVPGGLNAAPAHSGETRDGAPPTTTRFARERAFGAGPPTDDEPEEEAVVLAVGVELGLDDQDAALRRAASLDTALENEEAALADIEARADDAFFALRIRLLERWPVLDDPWHPDFESVLREDAERIDAVLERSEEAAVHVRASADYDEALARVDALQVERARVEVLLRAYENLALAAAAAQAGGDDFATYRRLRRCERLPP